MRPNNLSDRARRNGGAVGWRRHHTSAAPQSQSSAHRNQLFDSSGPTSGSAQRPPGVRQISGAGPRGGDVGRPHPGGGLLAIRRPLFPHDPDDGRLGQRNNQVGRCGRRGQSRLSSRSERAASTGQPNGTPRANARAAGERREQNRWPSPSGGVAFSRWAQRANRYR